nr:hypothetical protein [Tanacetum cinerariifolium]
MMSLLIQGPKQPGNDIDVYLEPLIEDIKTLWNTSIEVYDAYAKDNFILRAMIFYAISDFPAYGNLSGYGTKGYKACSVCEDDTHSKWLPNYRKMVYMSHQDRFERITYTMNGKVIDPEVLDEWISDIILTLCQLEMYFPPSFFDVMVHLVPHIVGEIKACGPTFLRNMYPFERYMGFLKGYVRNRYQPEASIIQGYATEEVIEFCTNSNSGVTFKAVTPEFSMGDHEARGVKVDDYEFTSDNLSINGYASEPFILAKQANQIFFVEDPSDSRWHIVLHGKRRIVGVENVVDEDKCEKFDEYLRFLSVLHL